MADSLGTDLNLDWMLPERSKIVEFRSHLVEWFRTQGRCFPWRNKSASDYERIVSEVLLQRTQADTVARFLVDFRKRFPSWATLAEATEEDLQFYLRPIGLWRRRATTLRRLAIEMTRRRGQMPKNRAEIEQLPGVGQYIANAILLFCHGEPQPLLDVNMARVLERYFGPRKLADLRDDPYLQALAVAVVSCDTPVIVNFAVLDIAALICKARSPACQECPVNGGCRFAGQQT